MYNTEKEDREMRAPMISYAQEIEQATIGLVDVMRHAGFVERDTTAWKVKTLADRLMTEVIGDEGGG